MYLMRPHKRTTITPMVYCEYAGVMEDSRYQASIRDRVPLSNHVSPSSAFLVVVHHHGSIS